MDKNKNTISPSYIVSGGYWFVISKFFPLLPILTCDIYQGGDTTCSLKIKAQNVNEYEGKIIDYRVSGYGSKSQLYHFLAYNLGQVP